MGANPHANGGLLLRDLRLPDFRDYAVDVPKPGAVERGSHARHGPVPARRDAAERPTNNFRVFGPDETASNRLGRAVRGDQSRLDGEILPTDDHVAPDGRVMEVLSEHHVPGLARRLSADRAARLLLVLRSVHPHHRFDVQPARQVAEGDARTSLAAADRVAELSAHRPRLAAGPQRLQPSGSRLHRSRGEQEGGRGEGLSAARCEHAAVGDRSLPAQPQLRQRDRRRQAAGAAVAATWTRRFAHCTAGIGIWDMGQQRRRRGAGRRDGVRRRCPDAGDAGRGRSAADSICPT